VGWVLREISKFDFDYVLNFLETNIKLLSNDVINNALKYSDKNMKTDFISAWKEAKKNN